jgi:hypothetical protein
MPDSTVQSWNYEMCCRELDGERHRRHTLKLLLARAKQDQLQVWIFAAFRKRSTRPNRTLFVAAEESALTKQMIRLLKWA